MDCDACIWVGVQRITASTSGKAKLSANIMIDCSHANSWKKPELQPLVMRDVVHQIREGNTSVVGFMVESFLERGNQPIPADLSQLKYGCSVTDACLDWSETERDEIQAFGDWGVKYLTLYAFSTENWNRPAEEVRGLLGREKGRSARRARCPVIRILVLHPCLAGWRGGSPRGAARDADRRGSAGGSKTLPRKIEPRPRRACRRGRERGQSAGFQMIANASGSSCPAARPRLA